MTRDDIIRMAREAELLLDIDTTFPYAEGTDIGPMLEKFAALVAAAEREACAKVCEDYTDRYAGCEDEGHGYEIAAAIRARGET